MEIQRCNLECRPNPEVINHDLPSIILCRWKSLQNPGHDFSKGKDTTGFGFKFGTCRISVTTHMSMDNVTMDPLWCVIRVSNSIPFPKHHVQYPCWISLEVYFFGCVLFFLGPSLQGRPQADPSKWGEMGPLSMAVKPKGLPGVISPYFFFWRYNPVINGVLCTTPQ